MSEKRAAVLLADGFEEGESLFVVDIFRRTGVKADSVSSRHVSDFKNILIRGLLSVLLRRVGSNHIVTSLNFHAHPLLK